MVNDYLTELVSDRFPVSTCYEKECLRNLKESNCFVSLDPQSEKETPFQYELPDNSTIEVGKEQYLSAESLFNT